MLVHHVVVYRSTDITPCTLLLASSSILSPSPSSLSIYCYLVIFIRVIPARLVLRTPTTTMRSTRTAGTSVGGEPGENDRSRDGSAQNFAGGSGEDDDRFEIDSDDGGSGGSSGGSSGGVSVGLLTSGGSASSGISGRVDHHHSLPLPEGRDDPTPMQTLAGVAGNVLEWYDFAVFGYFGDIIGEVFFPPQAGHAAIVESFAVFGGAFMMRPSE